MIVEQHAYPIFDEDWGADEELLLIEGMKTFGVGNWQDIADHIGGRSKEEVEEHYKKVYLESETYPVPNLKRKFNIDPSEFIEKRRRRIEDRRANAMKLLPPKQKPTASVPSCHEVQGYMPGRLEFESEYENEAETLVKDMVFEPEDNETEIELKLTVLDIYNSRLTTRAERKRVMIQHGLLDYRKNVALDKKRSKEEKDLLNTRLRAFARLMTAQDFQNFQASVLAELYIRKRIAELQEYRRNGIRSFADAQKYETDKAVRMATLNISSGSSSHSSHHVGSSRHTATSWAAASSRYTGNLAVQAKAAAAAAAAGHPDLHSTNHHHFTYTGSGTVTPQVALAGGGVSGASTPIRSLSVPPTDDGEGANNNTPESIAQATAARLATLNARLFRKPVPNPLDISHAPDVELLSPEEQMLCSQLRILPKPYLAIKETLFRELLRNGGTLKKRTARELLKIDVNKTARIYEFFQSQKWIS